MDAHFREYLAAVAGMQELYGFNDHAGVEATEAEERQNLKSVLKSAPKPVTELVDQDCDCVTAS